MESCEINKLIITLAGGGGFRTGVDLKGDNGLTLLPKDRNIESMQLLLALKRNRVKTIRFDRDANADIWNKDGKSILNQLLGTKGDFGPSRKSKVELTDFLDQLKDVSLLYKEKITNFEALFVETRKEMIANDGKMDMGKVMEPLESLVGFMINHEPSYSFLMRDPSKTDRYAFSHAINVCHIGAAVLKRFNDNFSAIINRNLAERFAEQMKIDGGDHKQVFSYYLPEVMHEIVTGFFLHDIGKVLVPHEIINKQSPLNAQEKRVVQSHSHEKGLDVLDRNHIHSLYIRSVVKWHHAAIYIGEPGCYPDGVLPIEIPPYVKICKIIDVYDATASKRVYGEAEDPSIAVAQIFRQFNGKDPMLQYILHSFIMEMGVCPMGSVVHLRNGQLALVLDRNGPVVLPLTDRKGEVLKHYADPFDIGEATTEDKRLGIDRRKDPIPPIQALDILPSEIRSLFLLITGQDG